MQHGIYIAEFEKVLFRSSFAISQNSLADLVKQVNFSNLRDVPERERIEFYEALVSSIPQQGRGMQDGMAILGEDDAHKIVQSMSDQAARRSFASSRLRDIWCMLFIGGCP